MVTANQVGFESFMNWRYREGASVYPDVSDRDFTEFYAARSLPVTSPTMTT